MDSKEILGNGKIPERNGIVPISKKEIDKEIMFSKIMPTGEASANIVSTLDKKNEPPAKRWTRKKAEPKPKEDFIYPTSADRKSVEEPLDVVDTATEKTVAPEEKDASLKADLNIRAEDLAAARKRKKQAEAVEVIVVNLSERLVLDKLDAAFEKFAGCKCARCKQDVLVMALNNVKPKYAAVAKNDVEQILKKEDTTEVMKAIMKAVLHIKANPRH